MARILITDDSAFARLMLKDIFSRMGHECFEACNGADLLQKYSKVNPDIVTLDITMPVMDGIQAVKELMSNHPEANVIMCSAMGQQPMVLESIRAGAKDFIVKPYTPEVVMRTINKLL